MHKTVVVSVNTVIERDIVIDNIYEQLLQNADSNTTIQKNTLDSIKVLYKENEEYFLLYTYKVIILPITFNLEPLNGITGKVTFRLDTTIKKLTDLLEELKVLQGEQIIEEKINTKSFENIIRYLK